MSDGLIGNGGREFPVGDYMTTDVVTVAPGATVGEVARRIAERHLTEYLEFPHVRLAGLMRDALPLEEVLDSPLRSRSDAEINEMADPDGLVEGMLQERTVGALFGP